MLFPIFGAGLKSFVGGKLSNYEKMITVSMEKAKEELITAAQDQGADAIVGFRFTSSNTDAPGSAEIIAFGTAVTLK